MLFQGLANHAHPKVGVLVALMFVVVIGDEKKTFSGIFSGVEAFTSVSHHPDAPKIVPLSALDRYKEGTDLRLYCSALAPLSGGKITFEWRKNNQLISGITTQNSLLPNSQSGDRETTNSISLTDTNQQQIDNSDADFFATNKQRISVTQSNDDSTTSVLRVLKLSAKDAGNYTCSGRNLFGVDTSSVRVEVSVRLKWTKEPPSHVQVRAGQQVHLECDASGQPQPQVTWTNVKDRQVISAKILKIQRANVNDSGIYECKAFVSQNVDKMSIQLPTATRYQAVATNNQQLDTSDNMLRKIVKLTVNGPTFEQPSTASN